MSTDQDTEPVHTWRGVKDGSCYLQRRKRGKAEHEECGPLFLFHLLDDVTTQTCQDTASLSPEPSGSFYFSLFFWLLQLAGS